MPLNEETQYDLSWEGYALALEEKLAALQAERDALRDKNAALEAENARLRHTTRCRSKSYFDYDELEQETIKLRAELAAERAARTLRPMSEAGTVRRLFVLKDGRTYLAAVNRDRWVEMDDGSLLASGRFIGWLPLPEVHESHAPDAEHYHE